MANNLDKCTRIPIDRATTPRTGYVCHAASWWVVTPQREILMYRGGSPQCNSDQRIAEMVRKQLYPECSVELLSVVYLPPVSP